MKLQALQVEIRPRSPGQAVALAARVLQHRPGPLLLASLLYALPVVALALVLLIGLELHPVWVWAGLLVLAPLFSLPLTGAAGVLVFSESVGLGQMISMWVRRTIPFAMLFLFTRLVVLIGMAALVVPGLYLWRNSWFLGPIVMLEGSGLGASLRRARRFAAGFHGHVLGHALNCAGLLGYLMVAFASLLHFFIAKVLGQNIEAIGALTRHEHYWQLLAAAGFALAAPLVTLVWFFVYLDVRTRKEGWDLEIAFRARAELLERGRG